MRCLIISLLLLFAGCGGDGANDPPAPTPIQPPAPSPAPSIPSPPVMMTTLVFAGTLATSGTFTGELSYASNQPPIDTNVRGLQPNQTFAVESYRFDVTPLYQLLPETVTFSNTESDNQIEYCLGQCVFAEPQATNLILTKPGYKLQLTFDPLWGAFRSNSSDLRLTGGDFLLIVILQATVTLK